MTSFDAIIKRSNVESTKDYQNYRENLRFDFYYACAYCSITEIEASGEGFEIDHYLPKKHFNELANQYDNLMWACKTCNRTKADWFPPDVQGQSDMRVIRVDKEDPREHISLEQLNLQGKSRPGEFTVCWLRLNRPALKRLRDIRQRFWKADEVVANGLRVLLRLRIDDLPGQVKTRVLAWRSEIAAAAEETAQILQRFIREQSRSYILDEDPDKEEQLKRRREFLKTCGALEPKSMFLTTSVISKRTGALHGTRKT